MSNFRTDYPVPQLHFRFNQYFNGGACNLTFYDTIPIDPVRRNYLIDWQNFYFTHSDVAKETDKNYLRWDYEERLAKNYELFWDFAAFVISNNLVTREEQSIFSRFASDRMDEIKQKKRFLEFPSLALKGLKAMSDKDRAHWRREDRNAIVKEINGILGYQKLTI